MAKQFDEFYDGKEFIQPADKLIEAIRQYQVRIKGVNPTRKELAKIANEIINRRNK